MTPFYCGLWGRVVFGLLPEQRFEISIHHLVADIVDSVHAPSGYLHTLASDKELLDKFQRPWHQIYEQ
jgi:hypothetical protein